MNTQPRWLRAVLIETLVGWMKLSTTLVSMEFYLNSSGDESWFTTVTLILLVLFILNSMTVLSSS